jgi:trehalose-6-phosphate synthase
MLQREVNELVGKINGRFGTIDAQPIFYINKCVHERASMVAQHPQCAAW